MTATSLMNMERVRIEKQLVRRMHRRKKTTPRKLRRRKNFQNAFDLESAKKRHIVIGRPCWPGSENSMFNADEIQEANVNTKLFTDYDLSEEGGFMNQAS